MTAGCPELIAAYLADILGASSNISGCNIGIALGAFVGSRVIDLFGLASVGLAGAVIIVAAFAATLFLGTTPHRLPQPSGEMQ